MLQNLALALLMVVSTTRIDSHLELCINFSWRGEVLQILAFTLLMVISIMRFSCRLGKIHTS